MLTLSLDLARLNLVLIGTGDSCLRRLRLEGRGRLERIAELCRQWRGTGVDHATVRRLTAAQIDRYGWLKQHSVAVPANDRGTKIKEPTGGGVS
jgi:hypothetical protein